MTRAPAWWLRWLIVALCVTYVTAALSVYPSLMPDPSGGFLVRQSMQRGAPWNHITEPDATNIARDRTSFFAIWSPGQYAVPGLLINQGLTIGQAVRLVAIVASIAGLGGWLLLFRALRFDATTALLSVGLIAASRTFNLSFLMYVGSDLLAFATFPFLALLAYRLRDSWTLAAVAPVLILAGFFFKNSLAIYLVAWLASLALVGLLDQPGQRRPAARFAATGVTVLAALLFLQWAYLSRGWTPVSYEPSVSPRLADYLLPGAMPLLAATSLDDLFSRTFNFLGNNGFEYKHSVPFLLGALLLAGGIVARELKSRDRHGAAILFLGFIVAVVVPFTYLRVTGSAASLDLSRHYLLPGYFLLPLMVRRISLMPHPVVRRTLAAILVLPCLYGGASFASNWKRHLDHRPSHSSALQIMHSTMTPRLVNALRVIDRDLPAGTNLVVVASPQYSLEFTCTRVLATNVTSSTLEQIVAAKYAGTVDNLVVIAELAGTNEQQTAAWLASFTSYPPADWAYAEADGFRFYVPLGQSVNRAWLTGVLAAAAQ